MSAAGAQGVKAVSLAEVSVPRLLFALLRQRFTGTLHIQQPPPYLGERTVWFRGGMPVFTDWSAPSEVLGQVLVSLRLITADQLLQALEVMAEQGGLLGQHLLAQGLLDRRRLLEGLRQQCSRKLLQLFWLRAGQVHVTPGETGVVDADLVPVNVLALVLTGVAATYDEERIEGELGLILHSGVQATSALARYREHFRFRPADLPLVDALARGARLSELAAVSDAGSQRAAQLIYTLWACQMLRVQQAAQAAPAPAVAPVVPAAVPAVPAPTPTPAVAAPIASAAPSPPSTTPTPSASAAPSSSAPPAEPPASLAEADGDDAFEAELRQLEEKIEQGAHAFELFGIELDASKRDVRRAWGDLSRQYHPDALKSQGRENLRDRVGAVFAALSEAQQLLSDADERAKLRESIETGEHESSKDGKDATAQAHAVFQSELLAKEGDKLLRANRFDRALERYVEAAKYNAEEPDIQAAIAWCEYQVSGKDTEDSVRASDRLRAIGETAPNLARSRYFLGFVLVDQGNPAAAIDAFGKAAQLDPRLIDAQRQQRALKVKLGRPVQTMSPPASKERRGIKGLFGRKK